MLSDPYELHIRSAIPPSCTVLNISCKLCNQIVWYPPCLWAPLTSTITCHFHRPSPWLGITRSAQRTSSWFHFLKHFSTNQDGNWYGFEATHVAHTGWHKKEHMQKSHNPYINVIMKHLTSRLGRRIYAWSSSRVCITRWPGLMKKKRLEAYFETKSIVAVQAQFWRQYQCRQCPRHKCISEWIKKFRTHGTILNLNTKGNRETHSGLQGHRRTLQLQEIWLSAVQASHYVVAAKSLALIGRLWEGFPSPTYTCTPTKYRLSMSLPQMIWESVSPCVSGSVAKLMRIQIFWIMCGFPTKPISFSQDMWIQE